MAEVAGLTFRFTDPVQEIVNVLAGHMQPAVREAVLQKVEPLLVQRDRQLEDAITAALACTCGAH